jgi:putative flippase GtrA
MERIKQFVANLNKVEFLKYILASALALAVDYGCYWSLVTKGLFDLPNSAVVGYSIGLVVIYFLITEKVFKNRWLKDRKQT